MTLTVCPSRPLSSSGLSTVPLHQFAGATVTLQNERLQNSARQFREARKVELSGFSLQNR